MLLSYKNSNILDSSTGSLFECCKRNFLKCFWICFKLVIKWVYEGVCPNFFIPENNMFLTKCHGSAQRKLFCRLNAIYERGPACIINWLSMQDNSPTLLDSNAKNAFIKELYNELETHALPDCFTFETCLRTLKSTEKLLHLNLGEISALVVQMTYAVVFKMWPFTYCLIERITIPNYRVLQ